MKFFKMDNSAYYEVTGDPTPFKFLVKKYKDRKPLCHDGRICRTHFVYTYKDGKLTTILSTRDSYNFQKLL